MPARSLISPRPAAAIPDDRGLDRTSAVGAAAPVVDVRRMISRLGAVTPTTGNLSNSRRSCTALVTHGANSAGICGVTDELKSFVDTV